MVTLDVLLNCTSKGREVINKVHQALMTDNVDVPLVKVLQHPRVCICPLINIAADVYVHNLPVSVQSLTCRECREKPPLGGSGNSKECTCIRAQSEEEIRLHWLELAFEIEGLIETMQLTPIKARHLQRSYIGEIIAAEALPARKLKRSFLLLQQDVKEATIGDSDGMQQAKESHQYNGYGVDGRIDCIIVGIVCVRHGLNRHELLSHCCNEHQDCVKGNLEGELQVGFSRTEVEPALILHSLTLRFALAKDLSSHSI